MRELLFAVYHSKGATRVLKIASKAGVILTLPVAALLLYKSLSLSPISAAKLILITGVPFLLVTLLRKILDLPRPYEVYDFYETAPKEKRGQSFPSRHVFSITLIGTVACFVYPWLGAALLAVGVIMATARVLLGIHFIRDVIAGALIGALSGVIGVLLTAPFTPLA